MPLTPATQELIKQVLSQKGPSPLSMTVDEFRELQKSLNENLSGGIPDFVNTFEQTILDIKINIHRSKNFTLGMPTLLYVAGGAFVTSGYKNTAPMRMARNAQVIVLSHRLAPEAPFPSSIDDIEHAFNTIWNCRHHLAISEDCLFVGGDSSGANFVIVSLLRLRDKGENIPFKRAIFISPMIDLSMSADLMRDYDKEDKLLSDEIICAVQNWYAPNKDLQDPELSPLYTPRGFAGFVPVTLVIPEYDKFRSQTEVFKQILLKDGVDTKEHVCKGQIHASLNLRAVLYDGEDPAMVVAKNLY